MRVANSRTQSKPIKKLTQNEQNHEKILARPRTVVDPAPELALVVGLERRQLQVGRQVAAAGGGAYRQVSGRRHRRRRLATWNDEPGPAAVAVGDQVARLAGSERPLPSVDGVDGLGVVIIIRAG